MGGERDDVMMSRYGYIELTALSHYASSGGCLIANNDDWSLAEPDPEILAGLHSWTKELQILFRERLRAHISQGVSDPQIEQIVQASRVSAFALHFAIRGSTLPASAANAVGNYPNF